MKVLVTGSTGKVGGAVLHALHSRGVEVRALVRNPDASRFPADVEVVTGDLTNPDSVTEAMQGMDKLFLINAVVSDELTQALIAYGIARRSRIEHVTYVSVYRADQFRDVPHFASKVAVENALREFDVPWTILRPGYFFQNDLALKPLLLDQGLYVMPVGTAGISAVDVQDIADAAAVSLTRPGHEGQTYDIVSSSQLTGPGNAALWSSILGRPVTYTGHDFDAWEKQLSGQLPAWMAYDMRVMMQGYLERGFASNETQVRSVSALLGRAPRTYEDFAQQTGAEWLAEQR